jgi:tetratricopeptide (TPR) repeat protein
LKLSLRIACAAFSLGVALAWPAAAVAQSSSSSSSSSSPSDQHAIDQANPATRPRAAQIEPGGAAVTLETSEPLFQMAAALNACGYDADLDRSAPVRVEVRADINAALAQSEAARTSRDALCDYIEQHKLTDTGLEIGQYVSLALYLSPAPDLTPNVDETELPPQAAQVVNILPLLRSFAEQVQLHYIWLHHHPEYEALTARVHDPMVKMLLNTNIYLHQPVSSYDGRRFLVLLEPMLSPALTNARVYGADYIIVMSPDNSAGVPVRMNEIRHIYLHYVVEPMVYSRGQAMERIQPVLRAVQDAPIEFFYKSDAVALITECLIKAIEARTYVIDKPAPTPLRGVHPRSEVDQYEGQKSAYDHATSIARQQQVDADESQGWVLTGYFYQALGVMEHNGDGLRDEIAPMIYGMDIDRERRHAEQIVFVKEAPPDPLHPAVRLHKIEALDLAEADLVKGQIADASDLAEKAMADPKADHGEAQYLLARVDLIEGNPEDAKAGFEKTLTLSKDPRTLAWSHIYLGRLYDTMAAPNRQRAVAEYQAALQVRDGRTDTRDAAEAGLKKPFALPQRERPATDQDDDANFDPTGKAQKDAYKPDPPK